MIFDVARHKFHEGIITLIIIAIATVIIGVAHPIVPPSELVATTPWQATLNNFEVAHPIVAALVGIVLMMHASIRLSHATLHSKLYPTSSVAPMALSALMLLCTATEGEMLSTLLCAVLCAEFLGRMLYSMRHNARLHHIFSAMAALGTMPLIDSSTLAIVALFPLLLISLHCRIRETIVATVGLALPIFLYCYITWLMGGSFNAEIALLWERMLLPSAQPIESYMTLGRLSFFATTLFLQLCVMVIYHNERLSMTLVARNSWTMMQLCFVLLVALLAFTPSLSPASFTVVMLFVAAMLPLFFQKINPTISVISYVVLIVFALVVA